jgi:hypothetical protein
LPVRALAAAFGEVFFGKVGSTLIGYWYSVEWSSTFNTSVSPEIDIEIGTEVPAASDAPGGKTAAITVPPLTTSTTPDPSFVCASLAPSGSPTRK